jgi:hypothetical protein
MPLNLIVGLAKKVGLPDYGSLGASCNVEVELDAHLLVRDPSGFQTQVRQAFAACSQAVQEELARQVPANVQATGPAPASNHQANDPPSGRTNGRAETGRQRTDRPRSNGRRATASQVRAIYGIAHGHKLDLSQELRNRFGVDRPDDLSLQDASQFIDDLRAMSPETGGGR